jgi:hypothetical protein
MFRDCAPKLYGEVGYAFCGIELVGFIDGIGRTGIDAAGAACHSDRQQGPSYSNCASTIISPMKNQEPMPFRSTLVCLPIHPSPERAAQALSITGAESTNTLPCNSAVYFPGVFVHSSYNLSFSTIMIVFTLRVFCDFWLTLGVSIPDCWSVYHTVVVVAYHRDYRSVRPEPASGDQSALSKWFSIQCMVP